MKSLRIFALASAALVIANPAFAASPNSSVTGKDASAATVTLGAVTDGTLKSPTHGIVDPTGAIVSPATSTNQATEIASLATIATNSGTQATAANQVTANSSLATIATNSGTGTAATGSAVPSSAVYMGAQSGGNLVGIIQASSSAFLNMTTAMTTKIISGASSKKVYITNFRVHAAGTTTGKFVEGTGTNCATGTADLSETLDLTASDGSNAGSGLGPVLVAATAADDICFTNSAAVNLRIGVAYEIH